MTKERKQEIIATYRRDEKDTGSPEVQIALLLLLLLFYFGRLEYF